MSRTQSSRRRCLIASPAMLVAAFALVATALAGAADATTHLWLYPDSDDPRAGGHVVTGPEFTLEVENRGSGNGDNTAYETVLLVAVNDPALLTDGTIALPDGTVAIDPSMFVFGAPSFGCSGAPIPPHGVYPSYFVELAIGEIAAGEIVQAGVEVNGSAGLELHFDATAVGYRQAGPNLRCYDVINPAGHDVTQVLEEGGGGACHELSVDKAAGATGVVLNDAMDYVITVENRGTCELTEVVLTEDLPTVLGPDGDPVPAFTVTAFDPPPTGQTATTVEWMLGTLEPGTSVTVVVSVVFDEPAAVGFEIANTVCAGSLELPDPICSSASVMVGAGGGEHLGGPGFWCNQLRFAREGRPNAQFTVAELEAWLIDIFAGSAVFPELWPMVTLVDAEALLCRPNLADSTADRLARHLAALWFNVVSGRAPLDAVLGDLCPGDEEPPAGTDPTMTVGELIAAAEAALLAGEDDAILEFWLEVVDFVNNASLPGPGGCEGETVRRSGSRRQAGHRP